MEWVIVALVIVVIAAVAVFGVQRAQSMALKRRFGDEYDRVVAERGDRRRAEADLRALARRRDALDVQPLAPDSRSRYTVAWRAAQSRFVDDPARAVSDADGLVVAVLRERGYPADDHEERLAMVSVDHPHVVAVYRGAYGTRHGAAWGRASTDDLRTAFLGYRSLFDELLTADDAAPVASDGAPARRALPRALSDPARRAAIDERIDRIRSRFDRFRRTDGDASNGGTRAERRPEADDRSVDAR